MKASPRAPIQFLAALTLVTAAALPLGAQDVILLKNGSTREGKITGLAAGNIRLQIDSGSTGIPLAEVREIRMEAPAEFDAATARLASGDAAGAVTALQKINDSFAGLPAPWAERAAALLGDAKLAAGDKAGAAAAYDQLNKTYPQAAALANLGRARLAVDDGKFDQAAPLLAPLLANSGKTAFPAPADAPPLSQAYYHMGRIEEAGGDFPAALASYLKASAVFPFDKTAATSARQRADALRAGHAGLIAP